MKSVTLVVEVTDDRRVMIDLPEGIPTGSIELTIRPLPASKPTSNGGGSNLTREEARERLRAAGLLSEGPWAPPDAIPASEEELEELGRRFAGPTSIAEAIIEGRNERY
jgi:hypothetical protein